MQGLKPIGILGGTFDPVHKGHLHLAHSVLTEVDCQEVRLLPCNKPVHRDPPLASGADRLAMLKLALEHESGIVPDSTELQRESPSFMVETLRECRESLGDKRPLCLILGMDAFLQFLSWHEPQAILELAHLVVAKRVNTEPSFSPELQALVTRAGTPHAEACHELASGLIYFHLTPMLDISASRIRESLSAGKHPSDVVPEKVLDYIHERGLYQ